MGSQRGSVIVKVALLMVVLMGMAALSADVGRVGYYRLQLQSAADLAAVAGAWELPEAPDQAVAVAQNYLERNGAAFAEGLDVTEGGRVLRVRLSRPVALTFARALGLRRASLSAEAAARVDAQPVWHDLMPWGLEEAAYAVGEEYVLKWGSPSPAPTEGQYQIIYLREGMSNGEYEEWVGSGYDGPPVYIGQVLKPRTGNLGDHTRRGMRERLARAEGFRCEWGEYEEHCPLLVIVPVVTPYPPGASGRVQISAFARFLITNTDPPGSGAGSVFGRFVGYVEGDQIDPRAVNKAVFLVR